MGSAVAFHLYPTFSKCESSVIKIPVIKRYSTMLFLYHNSFYTMDEYYEYKESTLRIHYIDVFYYV
jgi:hypothetical protein